jgi:hypothetical protein
VSAAQTGAIIFWKLLMLPETGDPHTHTKQSSKKHDTRARKHKTEHESGGKGIHTLQVCPEK